MDSVSLFYRDVSRLHPQSIRRNASLNMFILEHLSLQFNCSKFQVRAANPASQTAVCTLLNGILQTYESGDDLFQSGLMDPKFRKTATITQIEGTAISGLVKVYRPVLFQKIRNSIGMSEHNYLQCIDFKSVGMTCLTNSDSKSGQTFWISKNEKIVLKTIKKYECKNMFRILDDYSTHLEECSGRSCISTVLGLYRVTLPNGCKRYFMASRNVYPVNEEGYKVQSGGESSAERVQTSSSVDNSAGRSEDGVLNADINNDITDGTSTSSIALSSAIEFKTEEEKCAHLKFDLKGSTVGRLCSSTSSVLKDLNLLSSGHVFQIGTERKNVLRTLEKDVLFLRKHHFMDYSLLVAVEKPAGGGSGSWTDRFQNNVAVLEQDK